MAFGLPTDQKGQVLFLLTFVGLAAGYVYWDMSLLPVLHRPRAEAIDSLRSERDSLEQQIARAKREIAGRTQAELDAQVAAYRVALDTMRLWVPDQNEVATLIDYITTRAKIRGVELVQFAPSGTEPQSPPPFDTYRYKLAVLGHFDQVGEFVSDIGSLRRIMVPYDVSMKAATAQVGKVMSDTTGALLEVRLFVRTYVKPAPPEARRGSSQ
ncbi:MAG: type 4a pilus biogenesis protein PilO [Gemmatimonadales bacterium]